MDIQSIKNAMGMKREKIKLIHIH